jgi:oxygen-independent coproporphyrinogen-3 oxidase
MTTKPIGLYLHVPFCVRKCNYCDFCSFKVNECQWREEYIDALCQEIQLYKCKNIAVDSIFFGGGTPSLLTEEEFYRIVQKINECFAVTDDVEFTLEANPKTLTEEKLSYFVNCGLNRLSIGLQSIHDNEQKMLGRIHNYDDFISIYNSARRLGISNINVDLMYGIPEQTLDSFNATLDSIIALSPEHISLYGLILEEGTPFFEAKESLSLPNEDVECDMYYLACERLADVNYSHYEISNYAKDGCTCKHNLKYWHDEEYIGVGLSAHSYFEGRRYGNTSDISKYLSGSYSVCDDGDIIDFQSAAYEYVMLALRLKEGFSLWDYQSRFGVDFRLGREDTIAMLIKNELLLIDGDRLSLTEKGFYVSNNILTELL